jgi:hypothetical protein
MARPRSLGPYAPLSSTYYLDDALLEAGEHAEVLFTRGLAFSSAGDADGFVTDRQVTAVLGIGLTKPTPKWRAERLVEVGLWERVDGGYMIRSWLKWNKSAEEIGRLRKQDRERKASQRGLFGNGDGT